MKKQHRTLSAFMVVLTAIFLLGVEEAHSQQSTGPQQPTRGPTSVIVLSKLSSSTDDPVAEGLASTITNSIDLMMQLTGILNVQRADFLSPTTAFSRSLLYYKRVHADGAIFGSVKPSGNGIYVVELDVWNAANPTGEPEVTVRRVTNLLSSFGLADELSLQVASGIVGHKHAEGRLVVQNTAALASYSVYANGHLLGRNRSSFRILTGNWKVIVARPGALGDVPVQTFQVAIRNDQTTTVTVAAKKTPETATGTVRGEQVLSAASTGIVSKLASATGSIEMSTASPGVFYIDGVRESHLTAGSTRVLTYLASGRHTIEMVFDNGSRQVKRVDVSANQKPPILVSFASHKPVGSIEVTTRLSGILRVQSLQAIHLYAGTGMRLGNLPLGVLDLKMTFDDGTTQSVRVYNPGVEGPLLRLAFENGTTRRPQSAGSVGLSTQASGVFFLDGVQESHLNAGSSVTLTYLSPGLHDLTMRFDNGSTQEMKVFVTLEGGVSVSVTFAPGAAAPITTQN